MTGLPDEIGRRSPTLADGRYRVLQGLDERPLLRRFRVEDERIHTLRAVAVLHPAVAGDAQVRERFGDQYRRLVAFHHASVVGVVDVQPNGALPWYVAEDHDGTTLLDHVRTHGAVGPRQAVRMLRPVLAGLHALHGAGFLHGEVHLRAMLPGFDGEVLLTEPGLRWAAGATLEALDEPGWSAPEQRRDPSARSVAADLYGVGAALYVLLSGARPPDFLFELSTTDEAYRHVPPPFRDVIAHCCQHAPGDRPRDARATSDALTRAAQLVGPDADGGVPLPEPPEQILVPDDAAFPELDAILDDSPDSATFESVDDEESVPTEREPVVVEPVVRPAPANVRPEPLAKADVAERPPAFARSASPDRAASLAEAGSPAVEASSSERAAAFRRSLSRPPRTASVHRPSFSEDAGVNVTRFVAVGGVAGVVFAGLALLVFGLVVLSASASLGGAESATRESRHQLYQTLAAHENVVAAVDENLHRTFASWEAVAGEPARIEGALAFFDAYALAMRQVPDDHPHRVQMEDAARRFASSRENYREALDQWRVNAASFGGRTAISLGMGRRPPER